MLQIMEALEASGLATWVRESPSIFAYTTVLSAHAIGLAIVVGLSVAVDLRILGVARAVPLAPIRALFPVMYTGFWINAISGSMLFMASATRLYVDVMFLSKIVFVLAAVVLLYIMRRKVFGDVAALEAGQVPSVAKKLAIASLACWFIGVVCGRLASYPWLVAAYLGF